ETAPEGVDREQPGQPGHLSFGANEWEAAFGGEDIARLDRLGEPNGEERAGHADDGEGQHEPLAGRNGGEEPAEEVRAAGGQGAERAGQIGNRVVASERPRAFAGSPG